MRIAVASGKGGTGKTTLAVALALSAPGPAELVDCDAEEPNAALFFPGPVDGEEPVNIQVPEIDEAACAGCGACARACRFNAIVAIKKSVSVFPDLCHGCGACTRACPSFAIKELPFPIGVVRERTRGNLRLLEGELMVGKAMSPPIIRALKARARTSGTTVLDCPPGTSCPMTTAVRGADFVLLVTEPTPFGLHDLRLAVDVVRGLGLAFAVAVNRSGSGDGRVDAYCAEEGIDVLARIPNDLEVARALSEGKTLLDAGPEYRALAAELYAEIARRAGGAA